jgi:hypothetical protein
MEEAFQGRLKTLMKELETRGFESKQAYLEAYQLSALLQIADELRGMREAVYGSLQKLAAEIANLK